MRTAFGLVMLGKLVLLVAFVYFLLLLRLYVRIQRFLSLFNFNFLFSFLSSNEYEMFVGQSSFIKKGRISRATLA